MNALAIGLVFALVPVLAASIDSHVEASLEFATLPADDRALEAWLRGRPETAKIRVERDGQRVTLRESVAHPFARGSAGQIPWESLGYGNLRTANMTKGMNFHLSPVALLATFLGGQLGFVLLGLRRLRDARRSGEPILEPLAGGTGPAVLIGLAGGAALLAFGYGNDLLLRAALGPEADGAGFWKALADMPPVARWCVIVLGATAAPVCEEIFFRGAIFGRLARPAGFGVAALVSGSLFAAAHLNLVNTPAYIVFGFVLAWLYARTRSLIAPITAHAVNNAVGLILIAGG